MSVQVFPVVARGRRAVARRDAAGHAAVGGGRRGAGLAAAAAAVHRRPRVRHPPLPPPRGALPQERHTKGYPHQHAERCTFLTTAILTIIY